MDAYCTLIYSDDYLPGALVLAHALKDLGCTHPLVILVTGKVSASAIEFLEKVYDDVVVISPLTLEAHGYDLASQSATTSTSQILGRSELGGSIGKLFIWTLADNGYCGKIIYLDADVLPLKNLDFLFSVEFNQQNPADDFNWIAASPDVGWPDVFNSGFFVTRPSKPVFEKLWKLVIENNSFDGGDQGILNEYFTERSILDSTTKTDLPSWIRMPFTYNFPASSNGISQGTATYGFNPAFRRFKSEVNVVHFIGYGNKPWTREDALSTDQTYAKYFQQWKEIYDKNYKANIGLDSNRLVAYVRNLDTVQVDPEQWDATKTKPPIGQHGEAYALKESTFVNVWDKDSKSKEKDSVPIKKTENRSNSSIDSLAIFAAAEAGILNDDQTDSGLDDEQEGQNFSRIFPWESKQRVVTRVFPSHSDIQKQFQSVSLADEKRQASLLKSKFRPQSKNDEIFGFTPGSEAEEDYEGLVTNSGHRIKLPVTPNPAKLLMQLKTKRTSGGRKETQTQCQNQPGNYESGDDFVSGSTSTRRQNNFGPDLDSKAEVWDPAKKLEELAQASSRLLTERLEILRKKEKEEDETEPETEIEDENEETETEVDNKS
ncbi:nucleotide-diphospho-sugar transferase [Nadsonia fulvescens var. elongata DSM 6958]|uniref:glycogenin glucosyltransferase n=1 Tax=Nadsonia fulvescens var. elongata DSM 6958 TaxID=857566 RepID=A0A1E3PPK0_9ASCO|nr:nucleotide-diphospho-sugar transferase [Nadsonia fulvescens var. elongata DSM 6958]